MPPVSRVATSICKIEPVQQQAFVVCGHPLPVRAIPGLVDICDKFHVLSISDTHLANRSIDMRPSNNLQLNYITRRSNLTHARGGRFLHPQHASSNAEIASIANSARSCPSCSLRKNRPAARYIVSLDQRPRTCSVLQPADRPLRHRRLCRGAFGAGASSPTWALRRGTPAVPQASMTSPELVSPFVPPLEPASTANGGLPPPSAIFTAETIAAAH